MGSVITSILTDAGQRDPKTVGTALKNEADIAAPWNSAY
jgi:hypothetical protein